MVEIETTVFSVICVLQKLEEGMHADVANHACVMDM